METLGGAANQASSGAQNQFITVMATLKHHQFFIKKPLT